MLYPNCTYRPFLRFIVESDEGSGGEGDDHRTEPVAPVDDAPESEWKSYAKLWEKRARSAATGKSTVIHPDELKALRDKAKKFDELEEQSKTDLEKAVARAEAAEKAIAERDAKEQAKTLAEEIAKTKSDGLASPIPASALRGTTREELEAHADELAALLPKATGAAPADGQGKTGRIGEGEMSPDDIVAAATKR